MQNDFGIDHFEKKPDSGIEFEDFKFELDWDKKDDNNEQQAGDSFFTKSFKEKQDIDLSLNDFADPEDLAEKRSHLSQMFNASKPNSNHIEDPSNKSRHLDDISFLLSNSLHANQFVFSRDDNMQFATYDESFEKLRKLVKEPKPKALTEFFKQLSESGKGEPNDSFLKREMYSNREEFEQYLKNLKLQKRMREEQHMRQVEIGVSMAKQPRSRLLTFGIPNQIDEVQLEPIGIHSNIKKQFSSGQKNNQFKFEEMRGSFGSKIKSQEEIRNQDFNRIDHYNFEPLNTKPTNTQFLEFEQNKPLTPKQQKNQTVNTSQDKFKFDKQPQSKSDPFLNFDFGTNSSGSFKKSPQQDFKFDSKDQKNVFGSNFGSSVSNKKPDTNFFADEFQNKPIEKPIQKPFERPLQEFSQPLQKASQPIDKFDNFRQFDQNIADEMQRSFRESKEQLTPPNSQKQLEMPIEPPPTVSVPIYPPIQPTFEQPKRKQPEQAPTTKLPEQQIDDYFAAVPDAPITEATPPLDKTPSAISDNQKKPDEAIEYKPVTPSPAAPVAVSRPPPPPPVSFGTFLTDDMMNPDFDEAKLPGVPQQPIKAVIPTPGDKPLDPLGVPSSQLPAQKNDKAPQTKSTKKLDPIREQNSNIFQKTIEQQKLQKLFDNYQKLKHNFDSLLSELKCTSEGQQKIITQLSCLKHDYKELDEDRTKKIEEERKRRDELVDDRQLKILELKKELEVIKQEERGALEKQIVDRIARLEDVVRRGFDEEVADKKEYMVWVNPEANSRKVLPEPSDQDKFSERSPQQNLYSQSRRTPKKDFNQQQDVSSPLQLRYDPLLVEENLKAEGSFSRVRVFIPRKYYEEGEQYIPKVFPNDHFFKMACVQQQTAVYQSFDFHITCRYSSVKSSNRRILKINVGIRNKTIMTLQDLIVVVYGGYGQALSVNPAKIFAPKLLPEQVIHFEIYLSNISVESQHVTMQMSFKGETLSKKKLQVKIPRPLTKFFDVQFTHQQQFRNIWNQLKTQQYVQAKLLNFKYIKSSQDLRVILPFIQLTEQAQNQFSYGLLFNLFNINGVFLLKLLCSTDGRASMHLRYETETNRPLAEEILNTMNCILFL